ncbi:hypothetical protein P8850_04020 [Bacillus inaquosorum]|nr:hypothetical protein [Bacillus inaquosorum]MCY8724028.1 hypothetical protein [Bacillus inaquosorum]MCY8788932.1 hypothetical protein [Bacillus inaquosorum]MCY9033257.1 hypothetical protein [Bacillus inaquosorum]MCY9067854.1 hypothetical protein [Bacillus inaquosorum]
MNKKQFTGIIRTAAHVMNETNEKRFQPFLIAFPFIYGLTELGYLLLKDLFTIAISLPL